MKFKRGICVISRCALDMLSRNNWLRKEKLDIQDVNCGCPDCVRRAERLMKEKGISIRVKERFPEEYQ